MHRRGRLLAGVGGVALALVLAGCTADESAPAASTPAETTRPGTGEPEDPPSSETTPEEQPSEAPSEAPATTVRRPRPVSLPALFVKEYDGGGLRLGEVLATTDTYTRYFVTYRSDGRRVSGILNVPSRRGPHPALVLAHGYIDPAFYVNGQGLMREQDWFCSCWP